MRKPIDVTEIFGSNVFNDQIMKERLPKDTYRALKRTIQEGLPLSLDVANVVASAMRDWAIEKGATHYTHWFQPLTGRTAEKHDSFISPTDDGSVIMEFSGKQLTQGEPDASSFPSGGLRSTFEARGYTAWDCTSPAFLKTDASGNVTLCIPTAFCSYTSEALDEKTPLLRSMEAVSKQAIRVVKALGNKTSKRVTSTVGPEQEYFLIDKTYYDKRLDLIVSGRTLFGAPAPKGQELEDQYFGAIKDRIAAFMRDLDVELWKMGISSKTKHNEVAPAQFEMAPIFSTANIAADHNQLVMETMQKVALRHGLVCLLHEKPFAGMNGSGKHNNWSLSTDDGINLFEPGRTPAENQQFLIFISAVIMAVDRHAGKLRASCGNPGNDRRLGTNEAPPTIISIFMGEEFTEILRGIAQGKKVVNRGQNFLQVGVDSLPQLPKDNTDRNRTSPFAFTGNKFEFRMVGSSASISGPNTVINTIVADALAEIATRLEKAGKGKLNREAAAIVRDAMKKHGRVIFNGNNYSDAWIAEARKRGLPNVRTGVNAFAAMASPEAVKLFEKHKVLSGGELHARHEIYLDGYVKHVNIEAQASVQMAKKLYIPSVIKFTDCLAGTIGRLRAVTASARVQKELLASVTELLESANDKLATLETAIVKAHHIEGLEARAFAFRDKVVTAMNALRKDIDALENIVPSELWPVPGYADMLFKL
ncbi:MAG TPA: glutamine synthetase III [Candidatus Omnitrophota bacterium]|jgi:glutamine synthetase|nr:glutamine synthetase III [Candidatus Omnitrophota bacterium]HQB93591.1 glutamine synthetase III [Candidatus Omnitrophota bacterium]